MFSTVHDNYNPHGLHVHLHRDEVIQITEKVGIKALRIALVEIDGAFLAIRTLMMTADCSQQTIRILGSLSEAEDYLDTVEEYFVDPEPSREDAAIVTEWADLIPASAEF
jgi:hypothetical protein